MLEKLIRVGGKKRGLALNQCMEVKTFGKLCCGGLNPAETDTEKCKSAARSARR